MAPMRNLAGDDTQTKKKKKKFKSNLRLQVWLKISIIMFVSVWLTNMLQYINI